MIWREFVVEHQNLFIEAQALAQMSANEILVEKGVINENEAESEIDTHRHIHEVATSPRALSYYLEIVRNQWIQEHADVGMDYMNLIDESELSTTIWELVSTVDRIQQLLGGKMFSQHTRQVYARRAVLELSMMVSEFG